MSVENMFPASAWITAEKPALITFDDGPDLDITPRVLEIVNSFGLQCIFFVSAYRCQDDAHRRVVNNVVADGHLVGSHGYKHSHPSEQSVDSYTKDLQLADEVLSSLVTWPRLYRPPFGEMNESQRVIAQANRLIPLFWNVDPEDWQRDGDEWVARGIRQLRSRSESIVLLHDVHPTTADNLESFLNQAGSICSFPRFFSKGSSESGVRTLNWDKEPGLHSVWR